MPRVFHLLFPLTFFWLLGLFPLAALSEPPREGVPPNGKETFARALEELERADAGVRTNPDSLPARLDRLRVLFVLGVKEASYLDLGEEEVGAIRARIGKDTSSDDLLLAYRGALRVVKGKHGFNMNRRLENLKAGLPMLDSAIAHAPDHPEIRYLRLVSGYYLPFFIGRKDEVRADFDALARLLPKAKGGYPPKWYLTVAGFVLAKGKLKDAEKAGLSASIKEVAQASGLPVPTDGG